MRRFSWLLLLPLLACSGGLPSDTCGDTSVNQAALSPRSLNLAVGASAEIDATVTDKCGQNLAGRTVMWSSRDSDIALVTSTGALTALVTAIDTGTAGIVGTVATLADSGVVAVADTVTRPPPPPAI